jgi:NAD(P)-dependent dehydrogenase (short-subunit alcohol dehydrogenase family)
MGTVVVTGSASGIGAATRERLEKQGERVIGVDLHKSEIVADLATPQGRDLAVRRIGELAGGALDGLVTCAGLCGLPDRPGSALVAVNYFGTVDLLARLRPLLAARGGAAVAISSNSVTTQPGVPRALVDACIAGDEAEARRVGDVHGSILAYPATKIGVARWVRRHAPTPEWIGAGIRLNAIAPGMTDTAMIAEGRRDPTIGPLLDQFPLPIGRMAQPEEMAALLCFLLGPDGRFFVGSLLFNDGGTDALLRADDYPTA